MVTEGTKQSLLSQVGPCVFLVSTLTLASRLVQKDDCVCEGCYLLLPTSPPISGEPSGFEQGWEAAEILGATEVDNQILFLIKW